MSGAPARRRDREAPELGQAAARMMRALVRRAQGGDTQALEQLVMVERLARSCTQLAGHSLVTQADYTYEAVAGELGTTRQAAFQRFSREPNLLTRAWVEGDAALDTVTHAVAVQQQIAQALA